MSENLKFLDEVLQRLCVSDGIGYTGGVRKTLLEEIKPWVEEAKIFPDGSVYGYLKGSKPLNVMLACHIDEIGFIVTDIENNGFIRFKSVGGCDERILPGQEVVIHGKKRVKGWVGVKPPHFMKKEERDKVQPLDKLFIDTGMDVKNLKRSVRIGDFITFAGHYTHLQNDFRSAKALDNRTSVACGLLILKELFEHGSPVQIHFVATSQEEFSGLGARIHSYRLNPDYCLVLDVTHGEYPGLTEGEYFMLNKGPVLARGGTIPPRLYQLLSETARSCELPYQIEPLPGYTGTDADTIAFNREGIPTALVSIPLRYMHTPVEVVCLKDIERTARLIVEFLKKIEKRSNHGLGIEK